MSLDVMKFSHQKIKVSLGLDEPMRADGGLVDFAIDADGHDPPSGCRRASGAPVSRFDGDVAVVTGAGSGIGAAVARRLAADGAVVAGLDLDVVAAQGDRSPTSPGGVAVAVDVADSASVDAAIAEVEASLGPIALVAHAAGVDADRGLKERLAEHRRALERGEGERGFRGVVDLTDEQWDRVLRVNLDGTFYVVRAALRVMIPRRRGAIVTTASTAGMSGTPASPTTRRRRAACGCSPSPSPGRSPRSASASTRSLRARRRRPMFGRTPDGDRLAATTPIGRVADPDELAAAFSYLLSDEASYVVGETMNVNGGLVIQ